MQTLSYLLYYNHMDGRHARIRFIRAWHNFRSTYADKKYQTNQIASISEHKLIRNDWRLKCAMDTD